MKILPFLLFALIFTIGLMLFSPHVARAQTVSVSATVDEYLSFRKVDNQIVINTNYTYGYNINLSKSHIYVVNF